MGKQFMDDLSNPKRAPNLLEENLKKALTELLILTLLSERDLYIGELSPEIERRSQGAIHIEFPYSAIYRISKAEYITESKKKNAPDGRLRQYYQITDKGLSYLKQQRDTYIKFTDGVSSILQEEGI